MTHIIIVRHDDNNEVNDYGYYILSEKGKRDLTDLLKSAGPLLRYLSDTPIKNCGSTIYLTSHRLWAQSVELMRNTHDGEVLAHHAFYFGSSAKPTDLEAAWKVIQAQLSKHEIVVIVTHGAVTAELPLYLGKCFNIEGDVHPKKTWLNSGQAVYLNTDAKTWKYLQP